MGRANNRMPVRRPIPPKKHRTQRVNTTPCPRCGKKMYLSEDAAKAALERIQQHRLCQEIGESERSYYQCGPTHNFEWEGLPVYHLTHYGR